MQQFFCHITTVFRFDREFNTHICSDVSPQYNVQDTFQDTISITSNNSEQPDQPGVVCSNK